MSRVLSYFLQPDLDSTFDQRLWAWGSLTSLSCVFMLYLCSFLFICFSFFTSRLSFRLYSRGKTRENKKDDSRIIDLIRGQRFPCSLYLVPSISPSFKGWEVQEIKETLVRIRVHCYYHPSLFLSKSCPHLFAWDFVSSNVSLTKEGCRLRTMLKLISFSPSFAFMTNWTTSKHDWWDPFPPSWFFILFFILFFYRASCFCRIFSRCMTF